MSILASIHTPKDLQNYSYEELEMLAAEIRQKLIETVSRHGGHLASNLGAVELTIALHKALDMPEDKLVFDVGHQCYTHKLLTGRQELLETLRSPGGVSGFPKRAESVYDCFDTGHSSTAISAAVGLARARDLKHEHYTVAALVGDGALTGGLCYEALNDVGSRTASLIILVNDNAMSISKNVGALSKHLTKLRSSVRWRKTKGRVKMILDHVPLLGKPTADIINVLKRALRLSILPSAFFESLGCDYLGPIDGHDIRMLVETIRSAKHNDRPVVIHAVTKKGKGYQPAEETPEQYHGVAPFLIESGKERAKAKEGFFSSASVSGNALVSLAEENERVVAVTAAMAGGTGLLPFAKQFPDRFFDVGIAEEHAATFCAGLAAGGMRPYFALYSTFMPRAADEILHDICLQNLPVTLLLDHAGFVPGDGATHQGVYDLAMLRAMPNMTVWQPADAQELEAMVRASEKLNGPCAIRSPKSLPSVLGGSIEIGKWRLMQEGNDFALVAGGRAVQTAIKTAKLLEKEGLHACVWSVSTLDENAVPELSDYAVIEESAGAGGLAEWLSEKQKPLAVFNAGRHIPAENDLDSLDCECGMCPETIACEILKIRKS